MSTAGFNLSKLPGTHANTTLMLNGMTAYSFMIEVIDKKLYEFTVCVYNEEDERHEYVLHCNRTALFDLKKLLDHILSRPIPQKRLK